MDMGKKFLDGRRIFGEGKTTCGFLGGLAVGTMVGLLQGRPLLGFMLAIGALLGDLVGSFIKRRLGMARGQAAPGLDQLGFVVVALVLASLVEMPGWQAVAAILILTPPIHLATNLIGYKLGLKTKPL